MIPMVMQSINGPCPLIAIMNVLLLREKIKLPIMLEQITENQLLAYIGESIMDSMPAEAETDENIMLNLEQNINDAIEILPKLKTGLDVNIRFTGITDFEYTPECIIFDLLRIPLYHGWLSDPDLIELQNAIGQQSYNQLVDNIITNKASQDPVVATQVLITEEFLDKTASQLTLHGLNELRGRIKDNEIGILFRNNHFLTLFKREGEIYTLVTDHGYLTEDNIVWETLDNIEGAGRFFDAHFQLSEMSNRQESEMMNAIDERLVNDFLVALSLKEEEAKQVGEEASNQRELDDLEVAKKLQAEEDRYYAEMIDKKEQRVCKPGDRQLAMRNELVADKILDQRQVESIGQATSLPGTSTEEVGSTQRTYAHAPGKCSIWESDRRSAVEQADSWNNELEKCVLRSLEQTTHSQSPTTGSPNQAKLCSDNPESNLSDSCQAQPSGRDGSQVPEATPSSTAPPAATTQSQQRQSSSSHRRSRSEKNLKESNCIVQ